MSQANQLRSQLPRDAYADEGKHWRSGLLGREGSE